jgi:hypothetical protein
MNYSNVILISLAVAIVVVILGLIIYDLGFTPATQNKEINKINTYLRALIVGYE